MGNATTAALAIAALFFSLVCALLMEELIFGGLFRFFFAPRTERAHAKAEAGRQD